MDKKAHGCHRTQADGCRRATWEVDARGISAESSVALHGAVLGAPRRRSTIGSRRMDRFASWLSDTGESCFGEDRRLGLAIAQASARAERLGRMWPAGDSRRDG